MRFAAVFEEISTLKPLLPTQSARPAACSSMLKRPGVLLRAPECHAEGNLSANSTHQNVAFTGSGPIRLATSRPPAMAVGLKDMQRLIRFFRRGTTVRVI
jgi:hypothetical protein